MEMTPRSVSSGPIWTNGGNAAGSACRTGHHRSVLRRAGLVLSIIGLLLGGCTADQAGSQSAPSRTAPSTTAPSAAAATPSATPPPPASRTPTPGASQQPRPKPHPISVQALIERSYD